MSIVYRLGDCLLPTDLMDRQRQVVDRRGRGQRSFERGSGFGSQPIASLVRWWGGRR